MGTAAVARALSRLAVILLCTTAASLSVVSAARAGIGFFCGEVADATDDLVPHGIAVGKNYAARLDLTGRPPDFEDPITHTTEWDCSTPGLECGEVHFRFEGFRLPQTAPFGVPILGNANATSIQRRTGSYRLGGDFPGFVPGGASQLDLDILCPGCWSLAHIQSPEAQVTLGTPNVAGTVRLAMQVPGVGGGSLQEARLTIEAFGILECLKYFLLLRGDFDDDNDVDLVDHDQFDSCYTGDGGGPASELCLRGDHDEDLDVDCTDRGIFVDRWTEGGSPPPLSQCGEGFEPVPALSTSGVAALTLLIAGSALLVRGTALLRH